MANFKKSNSTSDPAIASVLPESVTYKSIAEAIAPATLEDLVLAINSMIQECELSTHFVQKRNRELQILSLLHHDLLTTEFGAKTASLFGRLFERRPEVSSCDSVSLVYAVERGIMEYQGLGRNLAPEERREIDLIKQFREVLLIDVLGEDGCELAKALVA